MPFPQLLLLLVIFMQPALAQESITIEGAWIKEAPPGVKVLAGYMTIHNHTATDIKLLNAESSSFRKIEFHFTRMEYGVAKMIRQDAVNIPAGSSFSFSPGGYHLMLFGPDKTLTSGDKVPLTLAFSNGETLSMKAGTRRDSQSAGHKHH